MKRLKLFSNKKYRHKQSEELTTQEKIDDIEKAVKRLNLNYNFKVIKTLLDIENISFGQLRCAQFYNGNDYYYDTNRAAFYLVLTGLFGSKQIDDITSDESLDKTYKILDNWQEKYGDLAFLYLQLIKQLEERHFFMDSAGLTMLEQMSSNSSYKQYTELMNSMLAQETKETIQIRQMQQSLSQHILDITTT